MRATPLDHTEVHGPAGSSRVKVAHAFTEIARLCGPGLSDEASALMLATLAGFQRAWSLVVENTTRDTVVVDFVHALERFWAKLHYYSRHSIAARVVNHLDLIGDVEVLHTKRGGLCDVLHNLGATAARGEIHDKLVKAVETYKTKLEEAVSTAINQWKRDLEGHKTTLMEAERVLEAAEGRGAQQWSKNKLAVRLKHEVAMLLEDVLTRHLDAPSWYIANDRVTWEKQYHACGSYASVYIGKLDNHKEVVIRRSKLAPMSAETRMAFFKEIELWSTLHYPYILTLWGANHDADDPFMVCESAVDKGNLLNYLTQGAGRERRWGLLYETALGIQYLHMKNIIHGDLKLDNVVVAQDGSARVADFGFTRRKISSNAYASNNATGQQTAGAMQWRAPECVGEGAVKPQLSSDVYSFGVCILEAFVGAAPYGDIDNVSVGKLIKQGKRPVIDDEIMKQIPEAAWTLVEKMTSLKPEDRPTIMDVVTQLSTFAETEKTTQSEQANDRPQRINGGTQIGGSTTARPVEIDSKDDLPRVVQRLTSQSAAQKLSAMNALMNIVSAENSDVSEMQKAEVVSVLTQILATVAEEEAVQRVALTTLYVMLIGSPAAQAQVVSEQAVPRLTELLTEGSDRVKGKAAMALGALVYRNRALYRSRILEREKVVALVEQLTEETSEMKDDKLDALAFLTSLPPSVAEGAAGAA